MEETKPQPEQPPEVPKSVPPPQPRWWARIWWPKKGTPSGESDEKGINQWKELVDGPWAGLAIGLVGGAVASVSPVPTLPWIFLVAWVAASIHLIRHLFLGRSRPYKIVAILVIVFLACALMIGKKKIVASLPPPPPTADQMATAILALQKQEGMVASAPPPTIPAAPSGDKPIKRSPPSEPHRLTLKKPTPIPDSEEGRGSAPPQLPQPAVAQLFISQKTDVSDMADAPYKIDVFVQSTVEFPSLRLAIQCDGPITKGDGGATGMFIMSNSGIAVGHPDVFVFTYKSAMPPFGPSNPLTFRFWSAQPLNCTKVTTF